MGLCWAQWIHTRFLKPGDSRPSVLGNFLDLFHEWISCSYFHCSPFLKMPLLWTFAFFSNLPARSFALSRKFYLEFVYTCSCLLLALCLFLPVGFTSLLWSLSFTLETSQIPGNSYPLMNKTKKLTGSFVNRKACQLWTSLWESLDGLCWGRPIVNVFGLFLLGWSDCLEKSLMVAGEGLRPELLW